MQGLHHEMYYLFLVAKDMIWLQKAAKSASRDYRKYACKEEFQVRGF